MAKALIMVSAGGNGQVRQGKQVLGLASWNNSRRL